MTNVHVQIGVGVVGSVVGMLMGLWFMATAHAAVNVRPSLSDVGFWDAALTSHGGDWLFYHYGGELTVVLAVVFGAAAVISARYAA